jgi:hypothetical protein
MVYLLRQGGGSAECIALRNGRNLTRGTCLEGVGAIVRGEELWAVDGGVWGALHDTGLGL